MTNTNLENEIRRSNRQLRILLSILFLAFTLVAAAYLRLVGLDWDENQHLHPDERFLTEVTSALSPETNPTTTIAQYFDTMNSTLNPNNVGYGFYVYGDFPVIMTRWVGGLLDQTDYFSVYLVGRVLSALGDLTVFILIFFIAVELFDWRVGLLASGLYGAAALPIQLSHFYTVDTFTNLFVVASFLFIARAANRHRWLDFVFFGVFFGLAVASKISVFPLGLILVLVVGLRVLREPAQPVETQDEDAAAPTGYWSNLNIRRAVVGIFMAAAISMITFRVTQPYAFLPPSSGVPIDANSTGPGIALVSRILDPTGLRPNPLWLNQMNQVRGQVSGYSDIPPNHQWGKRIPIVFPWVNMVRVGLGWPLGIFCWLAFAWAVWEIARRHSGGARLLPVVLWSGLFFAWQGIAWVTTMRYFLSVYPFIILLGAWALVTAWDRVQALLSERHAPRWHWSSRVVAGLMIALVVLGYAWGFAVSRIYTRPVTRVAASRWVFENVPSDATLLLDAPDGTHQVQVGFLNNYPFPAPSADEDNPTEPFQAHSRLSGLYPNSAMFQVPVGGTLTSIRLNRVLVSEGPTSRTIRAGISQDPTGSTLLAEGQIAQDFSSQGNPEGITATITIPPLAVDANKTYFLIVQPDGGAPLDLFGSTITTEGAWDDPIPLSLAPYDVWNTQYQPFEMQMAWEDIPEKRTRMEYILDRTDYLTISSNRFYGSLSRNPQRFPLSIAYYRALFSGDLGFDLVADFTSRPNLGPLQFFDDDAEEAWTVYDHPRVLIFKKTDRYSPARTKAILDSVDLARTVRAIAKDAQGDPVDLTLPTPSGQPASTSTSMIVAPSPAAALANFYLANQWLSVILWWILVSLIGWTTFPILYSLFPALPDRGYPLSRIFGLLLSAWLAWLVASGKLLPWSQWAILLVLVVLAGGNLALVFTRRRDLLRWLIIERRYVLFVESLMLVLFLFFILIRVANPDLWHPSFGGEKPMDMAYFTSVLKSQSFPPYDPWFAGGTINYYYFGFVIVGLPVKLLGLPVALAYNLILPTLFSLTGIGAFCVVFNLIALRATPTVDPIPPGSGSELVALLKAWPRVSISDIHAAFQRVASTSEQFQGWLPYGAGIAGMLLITVLGNLDEIRTMFWGVAELGAGQSEWANTPLPPLQDFLTGLQLAVIKGQTIPVGLGEWYWNATRLIPVPVVNNVQTEVGPITEFPYFTFLYADLHAHMIALPITLMALAWCVAQLASTIKRTGEVSGTNPLLLVLNLGLGALIIGALRPTNTWDWPTYLALAAIVLLIAHFYRRDDQQALAALAIGGVGAALAGGLAYLFLISTDASDQTANSLALVAAAASAGFGLLIGYGLGLAFTSAGADPSTENRNPFKPWITLLGGMLHTGLLVALTVVLFLPYVLNYKLAYTSFVPWSGSRTPLWAYLDVLGLFLFIIISWMSTESVDWIAHLQQEGRLNRKQMAPWLLFGAGILAMLTLAVASQYVVALVGLPLMFWAVALFFRGDQTVEKRAILAILTVALTLSMVVEVIVLQGDISRMNTVFKFYVQVWVLMGIVAAAAFGWLWPAISKMNTTPRRLWIGGLGLLVFLAALYPLLATRAKMEDRWTPDAPHTLDGMAYMQFAQRYENAVGFSLKPDYDALRWMQDNIQGTPIVLEAHTIEYQWGNRVTVYTGLPAIVGWNWHQRQQRPDQSDEVWNRVAIVDSIYNTQELESAMSMLHQYNIKLIIVGELERAYYNQTGLSKFRTLADEGRLTVIYDRENTVIYQVGDASP